MPVICRIITNSKIKCDGCKTYTHSYIYVLDGIAEFVYCDECDIQTKDIDVVFEYYVHADTVIQMYVLDSNIINKVYLLEENMSSILGSTVPVKL